MPDEHEKEPLKDDIEGLLDSQIKWIFGRGRQQQELNKILEDAAKDLENTTKQLEERVSDKSIRKFRERKTGNFDHSTGKFQSPEPQFPDGVDDEEISLIRLLDQLEDLQALLQESQSRQEKFRTRSWGWRLGTFLLGLGIGLTRSIQIPV